MNGGASGAGERCVRVSGFLGLFSIFFLLFCWFFGSLLLSYTVSCYLSFIWCVQTAPVALYAAGAGLASGIIPVVEGGAELEKLTCRHAVKHVPTVNCSVEEAALPVGEVVGYNSVKSVSRMNGTIVIFLNSTGKVNDLVERGIFIFDTFTPVFPLVNPAKKKFSNAPPFVKKKKKNYVLVKELSRYGQLVSHMKTVSLGCKSVLLKHVVRDRRQVFKIFKDTTNELNLSFNFKVEGFNYLVFASSEYMKCFGCGAEGHNLIVP